MPQTKDRMGEASRSRLLQVLEKVADATNDGTDPNDAIVKYASEAQVPAGHITHLVYAYNTGRTTAQRHSSPDVWEKAASFPMADASKILDKLFPDDIKSAAYIKRATAVSDEYDRPPTGWINRIEESALRMWARSEKLPEIEKAAETRIPYVDEQRSLVKAKGDLQRMEKTASEAKRRASVAFDVANEMFDELVAHFKNGSDSRYGDVKNNCVRLYGEDASALFNYIEQEYPHVTKQGASGKLTPARGEAYELVDQCLEVRAVFDELRNDWYDKQAAAEQADRTYRDFIGDKGMPSESAPVKERSVTDGITISSVKEAEGGGFMSQIAGLATLPFSRAKELGGAINTERGKMLASEMFKKPKPDANLDAEFRGFRQQSVLQDLLSNNDFAAGHDPHKIIDAYKQIADIAPLASQRSAIVNDFVRRHMAGGQLSYFDLEALTRLEKNLAGVKSKEEEKYEAPAKV